ncbi:type II toxin-antitoxin system HicB family antitoxin [Demequina silvatica]|uniref:type II toxin-antitoxin system HicB family antitoxin n=1 Tax=Demequina silvatica TaxID=1638988 RepID=UPI000781A7FD|nr:toxin-antitoxin system HicB family antitoxin [Demequina silvatica]
MNAAHFTYRVTWSPEDAEYVGTVAEFPSLSWLDADERAAFDGIRGLAAQVVQDLREAGEEVPEALADRSYSGKFQVRTTPARHRELAIAAAEAGVSMNRLVNDRLASDR